jgi:hypothetical protein
MEELLPKKVKDRADKDPDFIPKNVHLVLDMSKRRQYPITKGNRISGYHMNIFRNEVRIFICSIFNFILTE